MAVPFEGRGLIIYVRNESLSQICVVKSVGSWLHSQGSNVDSDLIDLWLSAINSNSQASVSSF